MINNIFIILWESIYDPHKIQYLLQSNYIRKLQLNSKKLELVSNLRQDFI